MHISTGVNSKTWEVGNKRPQGSTQAVWPPVRRGLTAYRYEIKTHLLKMPRNIFSFEESSGGFSVAFEASAGDLTASRVSGAEVLWRAAEGSMVTGIDADPEEA